jgi:hypothetical protein
LSSPVAVAGPSVHDEGMASRESRFTSPRFNRWALVR